MCRLGNIHSADLRCNTGPCLSERNYSTAIDRFKTAPHQIYNNILQNARYLFNIYIIICINILLTERVEIYQAGYQKCLDIHAINRERQTTYKNRKQRSQCEFSIWNTFSSEKYSAVFIKPTWNSGIDGILSEINSARPTKAVIPLVGHTKGYSFVIGYSFVQH